MKQPSICLKGHEVRAILSGGKTQHRVSIKLPHQNPLGVWEPGTIGGGTAVYADGTPAAERPCIWHTRTGDTLACPYGLVGDRLWVRETWQTWCDFDETSPRDLPTNMQIQYPATYDGWTSKRRPSVHMPRWASRIALEIVSVRVERLQDISEADAIAEGCTKNHNGYFWGGPHKVSGLKQMATAINAYRDLRESINGPDSWNLNPWVWIVEFRRITE